MRVAVTGLHAGCRRAPGLAVAICLQASANHEVIAMDYDNLATGYYTGCFAQREMLDWTDNPEFLVEQLVKVTQRTRIDIVLPCLNDDILLFCRARRALCANGIKTLLPPLAGLRARAKPRLSWLAERVGLACPETAVCASAAQTREAVRRIGLPCVIKGRECGVFPINHSDAVDHFIARCKESFGFPILVQPWLEGEEFSVFGLADRTRELRCLVAAKKIGIADDGETWMSVTVTSEDFFDCAAAYVRELRWIGPFELDIIRANGRRYLLDANPRFPAWIDGLVGTGLNAPDVAVSFARGQEPESIPTVAAGVVMFKDFNDACFPLCELLQERIVVFNKEETTNL